MITQGYLVLGQGYDPYHNLALEEYLLKKVPEGGVILYLWQNEKTVVIGKNQNAWQECRVKELEQAGGKLARRLSGGGAVFHDLGNLNFTFLLREEDYDIPRQLQVILRGVQRLGIPCEATGRNDLTVEGKKFSGNAFYSSGGFCYHHGTLMLDVDKEAVGRYLNVSAEKLRSKGVESVRSRVCNLREFCPDLTVEQMKKQLVAAMEEVYGVPVQPFPKELLNETEVERLQQRYASWEWRMGRPIPFDWEMSHRFPWGGIQLQLHMQQGRVERAVVYSDAMEEALPEILAQALEGCEFSAQGLAGRVEQLRETHPKYESRWEELAQLLRSQDF